MAMEVITTDDKSKRDQMFQELRNSTVKVKKTIKRVEQEVEIPHPTGVREVPPTKAGEVLGYRSTWSVAYPAES